MLLVEADVNHDQTEDDVCLGRPTYHDCSSMFCKHLTTSSLRLTVLTEVTRLHDDVDVCDDADDDNDVCDENYDDNGHDCDDNLEMLMRSRWRK